MSDEGGPPEAELSVEIIGERLVISIGVNVLAFAVVQGAGREEVMVITDPFAAATGIMRELKREDEDGTTPIHTLLDKAAWDAWENGEEGFGNA